MGDLWGGIAASALVLPQAMAFGIALWSPYTHDPASAALSGLIAATCLSVMSGLFRGTSGLVAAPTGPTMILLAGTIAALAATGLIGQQLVTATMLVVGMAGGIQLLVGILNLGHLVKFIPYPVVSGFMTGTAILMMNSQTDTLLGGNTGLALIEGAWIPLLTGFVTLASMLWVPHWVKRIPAPVIGLVFGSLTFHALAQLSGLTIPSVWVVGHLPNLRALNIGIDLNLIEHLPWKLMAASALALAVLASLDTLLTSVVADVSTNERHQAKKELMAQGTGHMLNALVGGMAGAGTTGATLVAIQSGGRLWAGLITGVCMLLLMLFMGPIAAVLPISMFAGIIFYVAIFGMFDKDIIRWIRTPQSRFDGSIALIVTLVTVFGDLMVAVGLGVGLAVVEFIYSQMESSSIHQRWDISSRSSLRRRVQAECECLANHQNAIIGYDLKGVLFFGTADHLYDLMQADLNQTEFIILDMRRVTQVDLTGLRMIEQMSGSMHQRGGELILSHVPKGMGLVKKHGLHHERFVPYHNDVHLRTFAHSDMAVEYAENQLLKKYSYSEHRIHQQVELGSAELLASFTHSEQKILSPFFNVHHIKSGTFLFSYGQFNDALFIILSGDVKVLLPYDKKKRVPLAVFGPGMAVGEISFLEPGPCGADARAMTDCKVAQIRHKNLMQLCKAHPQLGIRFLICLGHDLSEDLHLISAELRLLAS